MSALREERDILVVGGGMVGSLFAALLAESPLQIALIDNKPAQSTKKDQRVYAITRASEQIFRAAGIWDELTAEPIGHFRQMHVWDSNGNGQITFDSQALGEPTLGYIIPHYRIEQALHTRIARSSTIDWIHSASLSRFTSRDHCIDITLKHAPASSTDPEPSLNTALRGKLLIGADGGRSSVRELAGIDNQVKDYDQVAIVCEVKHQRAHDDVARQRFLSTGPLAFLPLADPHLSSIVWSCSPNLAETLLNLDEEAFMSRLTEAFEETLGAVISISERVSFPLQRAHASSYTGKRLALLGDAAHRIHPLAGQGANLGFLDAATLAQVTLDALRQHTTSTPFDAGQRRLLRRYERWRKGHNLAVMHSMDAFKMSFGHSNPLLKTLRNAGLNAVDQCEPVKSHISKFAMGLRGDIPDLAKPPGIF